MTANGRWTEARWLRLGDKFLTRTGVSATVVGLTIRIERVKVYNLQVSGLQLYAVGQAGVLVHNSNDAARYAQYWQRRAPTQSAPYSTYPRYYRDGSLKQVTTYDQHGRRIRQFDIGPGARHGEGYHCFEHGPGFPGGLRGPHLPFD